MTVYATGNWEELPPLAWISSLNVPTPIGTLQKVVISRDGAAFALQHSVDVERRNFRKWLQFGSQEVLQHGGIPLREAMESQATSPVVCRVYAAEGTVLSEELPKAADLIYAVTLPFGLPPHHQGYKVFRSVSMLTTQEHTPEQLAYHCFQQNEEGILAPVGAWTPGLVSLFHRFEIKVIATEVATLRQYEEATRCGVDGIVAER